MDIAIVDDEPLVRQQLEQMLKEYLYHHYPKLMPTASFLEFSNAEDFLPIEQARKFSLIFMDIYMDELNGMDAIRQLRQAGCNTPVIFLTNSTEHLLEGYSVFAAGYLVKPLSASYHRLVQTLDHCMPQVLASFQVLHIMVGHNMTSIPLDSICYLDRNIRFISTSSPCRSKAAIRTAANNSCLTRVSSNATITYSSTWTRSVSSMMMISCSTTDSASPSAAANATKSSISICSI